MSCMIVIAVLGVALSDVMQAAASDEEGGAAGGDERVWRDKYERLFRSEPRNESPQVDMSFEQVKDELLEMNKLLSSNEKLRESLPSWEIRRVEFWATASEFNPSHCSSKQDVRMLSEYDSSLPAQPFSWTNPNLLMFRDKLRDALQEYCISMQDEILINELRAHQRDLDILSQFGRRDSIDFKKAADYLAPYFSPPEPVKSKYDEKFPYIHMRTKKVFDERLRPNCNRIKTLSRQAEGALEYFRYKELFERVEPSAEQVFMARKVCKMFDDFMSFLVSRVPQAILDYHNLKAEDLVEKENKFVQKLKGCFAPRESRD